MVEVKNLHKFLGDFEALKGVNMMVPKGTIYGLVGPNGAGKTTLLRHITGAYLQDSGECLFEGNPIYENTEAKLRIASIPDDMYWFSGSNVKDMKSFYKGIFPTFSEDRYNRLKDAFSITEKQSIRSMSKGMKKQAAFWLAISCMPDCIVLDEPVDGLDPVMRRQIWSSIMADVADRGTTVIVSSHNLRELEDVCDRVGVMNMGEMMLEKNLSDLQGTTVKMQVVFSSNEDMLPDGLNVLHESSTGRLKTFIFRGNPEEISARVAAMSPMLMETLPLSLEEIFIYELGGAGYEVKDIVL